MGSTDNQIIGRSLNVKFQEEGPGIIAPDIIPCYEANLNYDSREPPRQTTIWAALVHHNGSGRANLQTELGAPPDTFTVAASSRGVIMQTGTPVAIPESQFFGFQGISVQLRCDWEYQAVNPGPHATFHPRLEVWVGSAERSIDLLTNRWANQYGVLSGNGRWSVVHAVVCENNGTDYTTLTAISVNGIRIGETNTYGNVPDPGPITGTGMRFLNGYDAAPAYTKVGTWTAPLVSELGAVAQAGRYELPGQPTYDEAIFGFQTLSLDAMIYNSACATIAHRQLLGTSGEFGLGFTKPTPSSDPDPPILPELFDHRWNFGRRTGTRLTTSIPDEGIAPTKADIELNLAAKKLADLGQLTSPVVAYDNAFTTMTPPYGDEPDDVPTVSTPPRSAPGA